MEQNFVIFLKTCLRFTEVSMPPSRALASLDFTVYGCTAYGSGFRVQGVPKLAGPHAAGWPSGMKYLAPRHTASGAICDTEAGKSKKNRSKVSASPADDF